MTQRPEHDAPQGDEVADDDVSDGEELRPPTQTWEPPRGPTAKAIAWIILTILFLVIAAMVWIVVRGF